MKNLITVFSILFLFIGSQKVISQKVVSNNTKQLNKLGYFENSYSKKLVTSKNAILSEGKYTFDNGEKDIFVEVKDGFYTEHYANNEFIKAKIRWVSTYEYNLIITEISKDGVPFDAGTVLNTKIVKVKGNRYYYESNLEGLTWSGKFIKK